MIEQRTPGIRFSSVSYYIPNPDVAFRRYGEVVGSTGRPVLIGHGVDSDSCLNIRQLMAQLIGSQALHDRNHPALAVIRMPARHQNTPKMWPG